MKINKLFSLPRFQRKTKNKIPPLPAAKKKRNVKHLTIALFSLLALLITVGVVGLFQGIKVTEQLANIRASIQAVYEKATEKSVLANYNPQLAVFLDNFVQLYVKQTPEPEANKKRLELLQSYVAKEVTIPENAPNQTVEVKNSQLLSLQKDQGLAIALVKVTVQASGIKDQEVKKEITEKKDNQEVKKNIIEKEHVPYEKTGTYVLRIPYLQTNEAIRVVALPSVAPLVLNNGQLSGRNFQHLDELTSVQGREAEKLQAFLKEFFAKYSASSDEDMRYMMTNPEGLNGLVTFDHLGDSLVMKTDGHQYFIGGTVFFLFSDLVMSQEETFELTIHRTDQGFVVDTYSHFPQVTKQK